MSHGPAQDKPQVIYLDNNATTRVAPEVLEEMLPFLSDYYGNPSSMHSFGGKVGGKINQARERVAAALSCDPREIVFTSCGTESDNTALHSAVSARPDKRHIVTTRVEHPAVLNYVKLLEQQGYSVTWLPVDKHGRLDLEHVREAIRADTAVVSVMWANNESGTIFPVREIGAMCREKGVPFHTDAVQAVGKIPVNLKELPCDYLALSGHKIHAPKGIGALYVRKGMLFKPFMIGGHQERGRRGGTENAASIIGLGKAMELAAAGIQDENTRVKALRDRLEKGLIGVIPEALINGDPVNRLPNTLSIAFKYIEGEAMLLLLDQFGICASSGSACTSGSLEPSHVLRAMGVPFTYAHGSLRFSLSRYTTEAEIDTVVRELPKIVARLRAMSPFSADSETEGQHKAVAACAVERSTE
ncbi:cysteine desulfurase NifS [Desulfocurvibacter africanus]|uniref:Cysteine desulfurase n=1 Tax=Desulfocurvibacter africanus subsp. africanus str. Walvis Bay TaxID=690850 RepID=F3YYW9_DESAF|nr:cysteine desulfurase NifS [Desulfocurvibacter africanus]EGJ49614.1 cysteine desulfurase NifS [Desulfocurvibacter africanus subsp. africanus str. Walvis Bay]